MSLCLMILTALFGGVCLGLMIYLWVYLTGE